MCVRRGVCVACTLGVAALAFVEVERAACGHRPGSVRLWEGAEHVCCGSANVTTMRPWGWAVCTLCVCLLWTFRSQVQARVVFPMYPPNSPTASVHSYKVYNT